MGFSRYAVKDGVYKGKSDTFNKPTEGYYYYYYGNRPFNFNKKVWFHYYKVFNDNETYLKPNTDGGFLKIKA